jgi:DNA polymerase
MATRDDLLQELGLLPQWRRRPHVGLGATEPAPGPPLAAAATIAVPAPPGECAEPLPRLEVVAEKDARRIRIAALEWPAFAADVDACTACKLFGTRNRSVPGVGDTRAEWLFVGEAPGSDEDAKGEPFVGQAGRLLDNMLAALGLSRKDRVYIANVLKCRPPGNRTPEPLEAAACLPYLDRQIALIRPRLIVALGKCAANALLQVDATIASLRGRVHRYQDVPLIVTYHPAYLLRTLADKAKAWEDLLLARRTMAQLGADRDAV